MRFLILAGGIALASAGCGQKGPLYLRDNPPSGVKPPKPDTYKPLPYPKDTERDGASDKN